MLTECEQYEWDYKLVWQLQLSKMSESKKKNMHHLMMNTCMLNTANLSPVDEIWFDKAHVIWEFEYFRILQ